MNILLQRFMANKHTTGAALVYGVVTLLGQISAIWFPEHLTQINGNTGQDKRVCRDLRIRNGGRLRQKRHTA